MQSSSFNKILAAGVVIVIVIVMFQLGQDAATSLPPALEPSAEAAQLIKWDDSSIKAPKGKISVALATSSDDRTRGLSGTLEMPKDSGMLFVFPNAGVYGFWMKDMEFPIDIVWIGADKRVSGVVPGVSPATFPGVFTSPAGTLYVLELNSGGALDYGIATGTKLVF
jgi:uncharacterized membrane protein (UPF0127 family)